MHMQIHQYSKDYLSRILFIKFQCYRLAVALMFENKQIDLEIDRKYAKHNRQTLLDYKFKLILQCKQGASCKKRTCLQYQFRFDELYTTLGATPTAILRRRHVRHKRARCIGEITEHYAYDFHISNGNIKIKP